MRVLDATASPCVPFTVCSLSLPYACHQLSFEHAIRGRHAPPSSLAIEKVLFPSTTQPAIKAPTGSVTKTRPIASIICYVPGLFNGPFVLPCQISPLHRADRASQELLQYKTQDCSSIATCPLPLTKCVLYFPACVLNPASPTACQALVYIRLTTLRCLL